MKKLLLIGFIVLALFIFSTCSAEIDLSAFSNDELLVLESNIEAEKTRRGLSDSIQIPGGVYLIGEDLPEGCYYLAYNGNVGAVTYRIWDSIDVYDDRGIFDDENQGRFHDGFVYAHREERIRVKSGSVFVLTGSDCTIRKAPSLFN